MSSKRFIIVLGTCVVLAIGYIGYTDAVSTRQDLQETEVKAQQLEDKAQQLEQKRQDELKAKEKSQEEVKQLEEQKNQLLEEKKKLEAELQAKAERQERLAGVSRQVINKATGTATAYAAPAPQGNCGDNSYAAYIYGMESGGRVSGNCSPIATNSGGCFGIGQDCNGTLRNKCGADYACQNAFFNNYAISRYGSWAQAFNFHKANGWW